MKTIKIFLASSDELKVERLEMTDLVSRLNQTFKGRGIQLELKRWEYLDSSMGEERKQDEYNKVLRECDICLVLFWRKFGSYTGEELDVAYQCHKNKVKPEKIYVFFKSPDADDVTNELKEFIKSYEGRYGGHFFNKFVNVDTLKLEFLLQFELYQKNQLGEKTIEVRNEHVYVDNEAMVDLNNIPFAANNEGFKKRQAELKILEEEIEKKRKELDEKRAALQLAKDQQANLPGVAGLQMFVDMAHKAVNETEDNLQVLLNRKNELKDEFEREQQNLFNTARRIIQQRGEKISERMARAIEAFEEGDARRADIILDEAEHDANQILTDLRLAKEVSYQSIEELTLKASVRMSNDSIPNEDRIAQTHEIYKQAVTLAKESGYEEEKYMDLLLLVIHLLMDNNQHEKAISYFTELLDYCKKYEKNRDHALTVSCSYGLKGAMDYLEGNIAECKSYLLKSINICRSICPNHPNIYTSLDILGCVAADEKDFETAIDYLMQAIDLGSTNAMYNLGCIYFDHNEIKNGGKAIEWLTKAAELGITRSLWLLGKIYYYGEGVNTDTEKGCYYFKKAAEMGDKDAQNQLGIISAKGINTETDYIEAFKWYNKAAINGEAVAQYNLAKCYDEGRGCDRDLSLAYSWYLKSAQQGFSLAQTAIGIYYNNGIVVEKNPYKAVEWFKRASEQEEMVGMFNYGFNLENGNGVTQDFNKAFEFYKNSADLGYDKAQNALGVMYFQGKGIEKNMKEAANWCQKSAEQNNKEAQCNLGQFYLHGIGVEKDYDRAVIWLKKSAEQNYKKAYSILVWALKELGKYDEALPWAEKAVNAYPDNPGIIDTLATVYQGLGRYDEALDQFELCLKLKKEQNASDEFVHETEEKITALKELMKNNEIQSD